MVLIYDAGSQQRGLVADSILTRSSEELGKEGNWGDLLSLVDLISLTCPRPFPHHPIESSEKGLEAGTE